MIAIVFLRTQETRVTGDTVRGHVLLRAQEYSCYRRARSPNVTRLSAPSAAMAETPMK